MVNIFWIISLCHCNVLGKLWNPSRTYPIDQFMTQVGEPVVKVLEPTGFTITVPDDTRTKFVEFYVNINLPYIRRHSVLEDTQYFGRSFGEKSGFIYRNLNVTIAKNDTIHYWLMIVMKDDDIFPKMKYTYTHL